MLRRFLHASRRTFSAIPQTAANKLEGGSQTTGSRDGASTGAGGGGSCNLRGGLGPGSLTDHSSFSKTHTHSSSGVSETRLDPHSSFSSSRRRFGSTGVTGTSRRICSYSEAAPETRAGNKHTCGSAGTRMSHRARFFSVSQQRPGAGFHGYHE